MKISEAGPMEPRTFPLQASTARGSRVSSSIALACASLVGSAALSQAEVLVADDFSYADGGLSGQAGGTGFGGNVWFDTSTNVSGGVAGGTGDSHAKRNLAASLGTTGIIWVRFDWGSSEPPAEWNSYGGLTFYNGTSDGGTESFLIGNPWAYAPTQTYWNISAGTGSPNTTVPNFPGMKSGVAKLDLGAGTVSLWVGATGSTIDVGGTADAWASGLSLANIQGIRINGWSGNSAFQSFDNLIIASTMADVDATAPLTTATWSNPAGGQWGTAVNWLDNIVATGSGNNADFNTLNIIADTTIDLDAARTIGNLIFGDTDTSSAAGWTLANNSEPSNILTLAGATPTITVNGLGDTKTATISAVVAGSAGLTKSGDGTLTLSAPNTYSGTTQINAGTLQIGDGGTSGTLGSGAVTIAGGATLTIHRSDDYSLPAGQVISGAGALIKEGNGTLTLSGNSNHTGGTTINGGVLKAGASQAFGGSGSSITLNGGALNLNGYSQVLTSLTGSVSSGIQGGSGLISMLTLGSGNASSTFAGSLSGSLALVKIGTGTLTLSGAVAPDGIITVQEGTLDLSAATLSPGLRINASKLAVVKLPTSSISKLYLDNVKLAPGRWGAPGSVAADLADFESPAFSGPGVVTVADTGPSSQERWKTMKHGFFVHYAWDGSGGVTLNADGSKPVSINDVADRFDAAGFADDLESMGVEHVIFTAWHANFYPLYPSSAMDKVHPGRSPNRDMIGDMITAVRAKGIRVLLYTHPWQPIDWNNVIETHNNLINDVYAELIDRYGDRIEGLFLDENFVGGNQDEYVDYPRLLDTIRRRNPELVLMHNWNENIYTCDMMHRETPAGTDFSNNPWVSQTTPVPTTQLIAPQWFTTVAKYPTPVSAATRSAAGIFRTAVLGAGSCTLGGGWIWGAGPYAGDGHWPAGSTNFIGRWEQGVLEAMQGAAAHIAPIAASIKNTYPSTSWLTAPETHITLLPQGIVATRSTDDTKEYIHVLNPPSGTKTLNLPPPADGKIFTNARLLKSPGRAVTLVRSTRGITLTLGSSDNWESLNTVIVMDVASPGERGLTNDNDPEVTYTGSWIYGSGRATTEYGQDVHETSANGDFLEFAFDGTDVDLIGTCASNRGTADVYIDDAFQETIDLYSATTAYRRTVFSKSGLDRGTRTLKVVKTGGTYLTVDAFRVTELINSDDPSLTYSGNWSSMESAAAIGGEVRKTNANFDSMSLNFEGNGIDVLGSKGVGGGTVRFSIDDAYSLSVPQSSNFTQAQGIVFTNSNTQTLSNGLHKLTVLKLRGTWADVDAFRIYKGTSASATSALHWGASGGGGTGTWNIDTTANWFDGSAATKWLDFGGTDYGAIFGGMAGTVTLASNINVNSLTFTTAGYNVKSNALVLNGSPAGITTPTGSTTISSLVSGAASWRKAGPGTLKLTNAGNTNAGNTTINEGTLSLIGGGKLYSNLGWGSRTVSVNNAAMLEVDQWDGNGCLGQLDYSAGNLVINGGTIRFTGSSNGTAEGQGFTISAGGATLKSDAPAGQRWNINLDTRSWAGSYGIASNSGGTLHLTGSGNGLISKVIPGNGGLTKSGAGTWTLTNTNTYTGDTTVTGGTLSLGNGTSSTDLSNTANVIVASGATLNLNFTGTDVVNQLWLGGVRMPADVYSSGNSSFITGSGTLTVNDVSATGTYTAWSGQFGYDLAGGPSDDDDEDGVANLLEYVLGGNPKAASTGILPTATDSAGNLVFTFRRIHATTADTTQIFQYGTDLSGWTDVPVVAGGMVAIQPDTPQPGTDTVTITVPEGIEPSLFGRLKVTHPFAPTTGILSAPMNRL
jgi:autotransporter-associated beta strand protein